MTGYRLASLGMLGWDLTDFNLLGSLGLYPRADPRPQPHVAISDQPAGRRQLWPQHRRASTAESQVARLPVSNTRASPQKGRLTYEGLFVGASLLHVGAWSDSTAAVVHLVHDATNQKEGKERDPSSHQHHGGGAVGAKQGATSVLHITEQGGIT